MSEGLSENPYESPRSQDDLLPSTSPGLLAMIFIVAATMVSAVCSFFCTCFGVGLAGWNAFGDGALPLAILCGVGAGFVIGTFVLRVLYRLLSPTPPESKLPPLKERLKQ